MIKKGEATQEEYELGLKRMQAQRWLFAHALQAFSGWGDQAAIDILRIEVIAAAGKAPGHAHTHATTQKPASRCEKCIQQGINGCAHVCGYCANVSRISTTHTEIAGYSKKSRERGGAGNKQSTSGF